MTDLGIYNFLKNELAKGKTKEELSAQLTAAGNSAEAVADAFTAIETNVPPQPIITTARVSDLSAPVHQRGARPLAITVICFLLAVVLVLNVIKLAAVLLLFSALFAGGAQMSGGTVALLGLSSVLGLIAPFVNFAVIYGYWMMRRWAVYLLTILFVVSLIAGIGVILSDPLKILTLPFLVNIAAIIIGFRYIDDLS